MAKPMTKGLASYYAWPWAESAPLLVECALDPGKYGDVSDPVAQAGWVFGEANGWTEGDECEFTLTELRAGHVRSPRTDWPEEEWWELFAWVHSYRQCFMRGGRPVAMVLHGLGVLSSWGAQDYVHYSESENESPHYPGLRTDLLPVSWYDPADPDCRAWLVRPERKRSK